MDDELIREFLVECDENLDRLDQDLVALEENPSSAEHLQSVFRTLHTIKGTAGLLGYLKLESVAHVGENLLSRLRDGRFLLDPEITSVLLALVDAVREILGHIEAERDEGAGEYSALIGRLRRIQSEREGGGQAEAPPDVDPEPPASRIGDILVEQGRVEPEAVRGALERQAMGDPRHVGEILVGQGVLRPAEVVQALQVQRELVTRKVADSAIRVDVGLLDKLMNLVGELVLVRNQILQLTTAQGDGALAGASQRLNHITTELQEQVMRTRMQPIGNIWNKFPRLVRDLAHQCGKHVRIDLDGQETELDKTIIEAIKDPLTHIVRNAIDHGIEARELRLARGKPAEGRLFLRAFHEGGQVNIEISDDGGGLDPNRIREKALERGLAPPAQLERMSERELANLIFLPGFSTAREVTNVSGRGVGMDVVKTNIESIGGVVDVQSELERGTTIKIKIPLTLAIIPTLIVECRGHRYAIPQVSLVELVRLEGGRIATGIERVHGVPIHRLRGRLLPLVSLDELFHPGSPGSSWGRDEACVNIVVLQSGSRRFGLVVDRITDTQDIVVKPLGKQFKGLNVFAGATIMGDGQVALILDVVGIAQRSGVLTGLRDADLLDPADAADGRRDRARQQLLIVQSPDDGRLAIPLSAVARLEILPGSSVEEVRGMTMARYRGQIMPMLELSSLLEERRSRSRGPDEGARNGPGSGRDKVHVVVFSGKKHQMGLVVDRILDIAEEAIDLDRLNPRRGVLGCGVIQDRVTEILDIEATLRAAVRRMVSAGGQP